MRLDSTDVCVNQLRKSGGMITLDAAYFDYSIAVSSDDSGTIEIKLAIILHAKT